MRIGAIWEPAPNGYYRAVDPLRAMERRGHEVVWPDDDGKQRLVALLACDVVHVYRRVDDDTMRVLAELGRRGVPIVYDNDDDLSSVPRSAETYRMVGGLRGERLFAQTVKCARLAAALTTTTEQLAQKYRRAGVRRVAVIPNQLAPDLDRPLRRHNGVVVGWVGGREHTADVAEIPIAQALTELLQRRPEVRVECVGVDLRLRSDRYAHVRFVPFPELPRRIGGFDIGIAPLADLPFNHMRSDIKLKEYAASKVPWLASPVGPYKGLGEEQGGRLVADDGWFEALDRLVTSRRDRRRLARRAVSWAKCQTIDRTADRWERVFSDATA